MELQRHHRKTETTDPSYAAITKFVCFKILDEFFPKKSVYKNFITESNDKIGSSPWPYRHFQFI